MKGTIIDYLKEYADVSLKDEPMNDVDSLVLCQFSYLKFDGLVPLVTENGRSVSLQQLYEIWINSSPWKNDEGWKN